MKPKGVSIIICCHNGASRLTETIRHIARQKVPAHVPWELLIVDNGCTDGSASVARLEWQKHRVNTYLKIVREPRLGLSHARTRGFNEARYEYQVLCDDDNWLDENYVAHVFEILSENHNIGVLGGYGQLLFEGEPPAVGLSYIFAAGPQAPHSGKVLENKVYGAGSVVRYAAYDKLQSVGFKSQLIDRKGTELSSGGDLEFCLALAILGYDIWYDSRLSFIHCITRERLSWEYFLRYACESSKCFNVLSSYKTVAAKNAGNGLAWLVMLRNFAVCAKIFLGISVQRVIKRNRHSRKLLHFRHLLFKHKLMAYIVRSREMVEAHRRILAFQDRCRRSQRILNAAIQKEYTPFFRPSFFSKPLRQLR